VQFAGDLDVEINQTPHTDLSAAGKSMINIVRARQTRHRAHFFPEKLKTNKRLNKYK